MNNITIVLNSSNYDSSRGVFAYKLPHPRTFASKKVALTYCSVYKQWENILTSYGNNSFTITWINNVQYTFTIPDGNYTIGQINDYIQFCLTSNNLYVLNTNSANTIISFCELLVNPTAYGTQLYFQAVPTSTTATANLWLLPAGATWAFPTTAKTASITFNSAFGSLIGFSSGTYGNSSTTISINSPLTPNIAIVNSLIIRTNLINSERINPSDVLGAMDIAGSYGDLMIKNVGQYLYTEISANNFSEILVYFSDQNLNNLKFKDNQACIILSIVDK